MNRLLQAVRQGVIAPGERLPAERDLATIIGVSRATVREAISTLGESGYVTTKRGRSGGTFVVDEIPAGLPPSRPDPRISVAELDDITALRRVLEVGAVREAAARELSAAERASLVQALTACAESDETDFRRLDSRIHLVFAELSGSPSLVHLLADLRTRINAALDCIPMLTPNLVHAQDQHEEIARSIFAGDPDGAAEAMRHHIDGTEALLRGFLTTQ